MHDTNDGRAKIRGNKEIWQIERLGRKMTRVRERIGEDEYVVTTEVTMPDGKIEHWREEMKRKGPQR